MKSFIITLEIIRAALGCHTRNIWNNWARCLNQRGAMEASNRMIILSFKEH